MKRGIRQIAKINITVTIPQFNNVHTKVLLMLMGLSDPFGYAVSLEVLEAGRNVDGFMSDIYNGVKLGDFFDKRSIASLDLGVVTNTGKACIIFFR